MVGTHSSDAAPLALTLADRAAITAGLVAAIRRAPYRAYDIVVTNPDGDLVVDHTHTCRAVPCAHAYVADLGADEYGDAYSHVECRPATCAEIKAAEKRDNAVPVGPDGDWWSGDSEVAA